MNANYPPDMDPLERALVEARDAVDSRGLRIRLLSPCSDSAEDIALEAQRVLHRLSTDGVALGGFSSDYDPFTAELNRAMNIRHCAKVLLEARIKMAQAAVIARTARST